MFRGGDPGWPWLAADFRWFQVTLKCLIEVLLPKKDPPKSSFLSQPLSSPKPGDSFKIAPNKGWTWWSSMRFILLCISWTKISPSKLDESSPVVVSLSMIWPHKHQAPADSEDLCPAHGCEQRLGSQPGLGLSPRTCGLRSRRGWSRRGSCGDFEHHQTKYPLVNGESTISMAVNQPSFPKMVQRISINYPLVNYSNSLQTGKSPSLKTANQLFLWAMTSIANC